MKGGRTFYCVLKMSFVWHSGGHNPQTWFCFRVGGGLEQSLMEETKTQEVMSLLMQVTRTRSLDYHLAVNQ